MNSTLSTPSVDFHFIDAPNTQRESPPPLQQSEISFGLSPTIQKKDTKIQETTIAPHVQTIPHHTIKNSFFYQQEDSQQFFNDFQSKFKVTLSESSNSFGTAMSKKTQKSSKIKILEPQQSQSPHSIFNKISLSSRQSLNQNSRNHQSQLPKEINDKIPANFNDFKKKNGVHPIYCFKNKKSVKNKLLMFPALKHAQSQRITKKNEYADSFDLPLVNNSSIYKHFNYNLCHTSKLTQRENQSSLRIEKKDRKKTLSLKINELFKKSREKLPSAISIEGTNKPISSVREKKQLKRSNIFLKLPLIR